MDPARFSVQEFAESLVREGLAGPDDFLGCSPAEIGNVLRAQRVISVPGIYRDFLQVMGRRPYPLMLGTDWAYQDLLDIKDAALELLRENGGDPALLDDALVIALHQGYVAYYVPTIGAGLDDPPVWVYSEGNAPYVQAPSFRGFLLGLADMRRRELRAYAELAETGRFTMTPVDPEDA